MRGSQRHKVDQADQQTGEDGLKREGVVVCKIWCVGCDVRLGGSGDGGMDGGMDYYLAGRIRLVASGMLCHFWGRTRVRSSDAVCRSGSRGMKGDARGETRDLGSGSVLKWL